MVPFISARDVIALSLRLTRLAAHNSINIAFVPLSGRAGAVGNVWCSKKTFLFPYGPDMKRFVKWDFCLWTHFLSGAGDTGREKGLETRPVDGQTPLSGWVV